MTTMLDLRPATQQMAALLGGVTDAQLGDPTPCPDYTLGDLIEHVGGLAVAFTQAATKEFGTGTPQAPSGDASRLGENWRTSIPRQLEDLAEAWRDPAAWQGMTQAGGVDLPGEVAGQVALNELTIHAWDISRASGAPFSCDQQALDATMDFVSAMSVPGEEAAREGLFGPVVPVPADAPLLDRVIGLSGRSPGWSAP